MSNKLVQNMEAEMKARATEKTISEQTEPWHKPKNGSVFPKKKRSVKQMMWDSIIENTANKGFNFNTVSPPPKAPKSKNTTTNTVHPTSSTELADDVFD